MLRVPPSLSSLLPGTLQVPLQINGQTLELGNSATFTGATNQILATSTQVLYNAVAAQKHNFTIGGSGKVEISSSGIKISGSSELLDLGISGSTVSGATQAISGTSIGLQYNSTTGTPHKFYVAGTEKYRLASTLLEAPAISIGGTVGSSVDPGIGSLALTNRIQFAGAGTASSVLTTQWADASAGNLITNVPSSKYVELRIAGYTTYTFGYSNNLATTGANVFQIGDGSGSYIQSDGFGLLHRVSNTYAHTFKVNTTDVGYFDGNGLTVTKNIVSSNNFNTGDRTANLDVQRYYNNVFWGWPHSAYTCSVGSFNGSGYPFICFYGYHSSTTNTIKRSSATNQPVWFQSLSGYISIFQGSSGTADVDCTGTEKYRFAAALAEFDRLSLGGTIGSSTDPGAGGLALTGKFYISTTQTPASAADTGTTGQICWDSSYIYICTATNTWKRAAIATW